MTMSAPVAEPFVKPTMSGLPRGLPVRLWKIAPEMPSATPTSTASSTRGRRSVSMMNDVACVPPPSSVSITSDGEMG
jgi:hypothetical protein